MSPKPFASTQDTKPKEATLEILAEGVYALTADGDPNYGAIEAEDFLVCFEALPTPLVARRWLDRLREHTDKPVRYLVLSHYHAVRVLGASAFDADVIIAHANTRRLIAERGKEDWASEFARLPRLAEGAETIPGLTWPTMTFTDTLSIDLGGNRGELVLGYHGRGHTEGDITAWLPRERILFAGDLVEARAALYTGDGYHREWATTTLDSVAALAPDVLVGGRGGVSRSAAEAQSAVAQTRRFLNVMIDRVEAVRNRGGSLADAFEEAHAALVDDYGHWPIFEHTLPFNVYRLWDELAGVERPVIWTPELDQEVWAQLQR